MEAFDLSQTAGRVESSVQVKLQKLSVPETITAKEALKRLDEGAEKILIVVNGSNKLCGTITDGDIRRWILKEGNLNASVAGFYHRDPKFVFEPYDVVAVKKMMIKEKIEVVPVIDRDHRLVDVLIWDEIFSSEKKKMRSVLKVPVLIMAGGKGARLNPLTRILPKPLIPLGEKPIAELIMDRFFEFGCDKFYLVVNFKGKMVQSYFESVSSPYQVKLIWEDEPRGTAGGLSLAQELIESESFFVTNCDVMVKTDYADLFEFHKQSDADITIVGAIQNLTIPYGVIQKTSDGFFDTINEKPEYDFWVNTGMYVIQKEVIQHIPKKGSYDFTELIRTVKTLGGSVAVYPVSQPSWIDVGQWQEYQKALKDLE